MTEKRNPKVLAEWLKKNLKIKGRPTNQTDAKKALNWKSDKITKIKQGNLGDNRENLVITFSPSRATAGKNRTDWFKQTTPDPTTRKNANMFIKANKGPGVQVDHVLTNSRLAKGEKFQADRTGLSIKEINKRSRKNYESTDQGYGHDEKNLQAIPGQQNNLKEAQEKALDKYYKLKENPPPKSNKKGYAAWKKKVDAAALQLRTLEKQAEQFNNGNNGDNGDNGDNGKKLKIKNGDKKKPNGKGGPPTGTGGGGGDVKVTDKKIKNAALHIGRNLPGALSVPATTTNAYMMIKQALATPSKKNIALAILGGVEAGADVAGLFPLLAVPAEVLSQGAGKIGGGLQTMSMLKQLQMNPKINPKALLQSKRLQGAGI